MPEWLELTAYVATIFMAMFFGVSAGMLKTLDDLVLPHLKAGDIRDEAEKTKLLLTKRCGVYGLLLTIGIIASIIGYTT